MANSTTARFSALLFLLFSLLVNITFAADPSSPSPAPDSPSPAPDSPSPAPDSPSSPPTGAPASIPSPATAPESPSPGPSTPNSPPPPSQENSPSRSPAPSLDDVGDREVNHSNVPGGDGKSSSGGMSSGKKAGIAFGVIIGAGVVILGALVYRKRRQNIERSQYGNAARRELL